MSESLPTKEKLSKSYLLFGFGLIVVGSVLAYLVFTFRQNVGSLISPSLDKSSSTAMNKVEVNGNEIKSPFDAIQTSESVTEKPQNFGEREFEELIPSFVSPDQKGGYYEVIIKDVDFGERLVILEFEEDSSVWAYSLDEISVMGFLGDRYDNYVLTHSDIDTKATFATDITNKKIAIIINKEVTNE